MDEMFMSFESLPMNDFDELVNSVCEWLEESFKSQQLKETAQRSISQIAAMNRQGQESMENWIFSTLIISKNDVNENILY